MVRSHELCECCYQAFEHAATDFFNLRRWFSAVDDSGKAIKETGGGSCDETLAGSGHGNVPFNASEFREVLDDLYFEKFLDMLTLTEQIPDGVCRRTGLCRCHAALLTRVGKHLREKLLVCHFGTKYPCPLSGCWAPEFAAGMCERLVEEVWSVAETKIFAFQKGNRLSEVDLERLLTNFRAARVVVLATLCIKLSFWKALP